MCAVGLGGRDGLGFHREVALAVVFDLVGDGVDHAVLGDARGLLRVDIVLGELEHIGALGAERQLVKGNGALRVVGLGLVRKALASRSRRVLKREGELARLELVGVAVARDGLGGRQRICDGFRLILVGENGLGIAVAVS